MPNFPKKAMVGYYLGNLGEMTVPSSAGFTNSWMQRRAVQVYQGSLNVRADVGLHLHAQPTRKCTKRTSRSFNTPGQYRLVVPGMGASLPFLHRRHRDGFCASL